MNKRGGILIYILGVVALLGLIVTEFLIETAGEMRYRGQVVDREDLKVVAKNGLGVTLAVLSEYKVEGGGLYSPNQGWADPIRLVDAEIPDNYVVTVNFKDETAKVSIYNKNRELWKRVFEEVGLDSADGDAFAGLLEDWLKKPLKVAYQGDATKKKEGESDGPRREVFSLSELMDIGLFADRFFDENGEENEYFKRFRELVTVYEHKLVNMNNASEGVRRVVLGDVDAINLDEGRYYKSKNEIYIDPESDVLESEIGFKVDVLRVGVEVARGPSVYYLDAVLKVGSAAAEKSVFTILALTEDMEAL